MIYDDLTGYSILYPSFIHVVSETMPEMSLPSLFVC
jgi:hypothetical protein